MRQSLKGKDADWLWQRSSTWHQRMLVPFSARLCVQQVERQPWAILSLLLSKVFSWSESLNMSLLFLNFDYNNLLLSTALYLRSWNICNFLTLWEGGEINSVSTTYGFDVSFCCSVCSFTDQWLRQLFCWDGYFDEYCSKSISRTPLCSVLAEWSKRIKHIFHHFFISQQQVIFFILFYFYKFNVSS